MNGSIHIGKMRSYVEKTLIAQASPVKILLSILSGKVYFFHSGIAVSSIRAGNVIDGGDWAVSESFLTLSGV